MNWADYLIIAIMVFSSVAGLMRGVLREGIAIITWFAALIVAWNYGPMLEPALGGALSDAAVRPWAARALVFIVVMMAGMAVGAIATHFVRLSIFNSMDRLLGFVFGVIRGCIVLGVLAILCHAVRLHEEKWYERSLLVPYAEQSGNVLRGLLGERKIHLH
jgi:membrane protein required for colicin V production